MLKVLFYIENGWAYGSIHHGLCKELYKHGIFANLLDWTKEYTREEFSLLNSCYDLFVTNVTAATNLYNYGIPLHKIIGVAHGQYDLLVANQVCGKEFYSYIKNFCVVSEILKLKSKEFGIDREPEITRIGIHFDSFYSQVQQELKIVGYGGIRETYNFFGEEIKRGYLVENAVSKVQNLTLLSNKVYNHLCMPGYYKTIDALVMSSSEEAAGLPVMEASAAGRLILGTPVGYFEKNGNIGGGIILPIEENQFVHQLSNYLEYFRDNSREYKIACESIQQFAKENYDWSVVIEDWVKILSV